jgi:hypothetical protein
MHPTRIHGTHRKDAVRERVPLVESKPSRTIERAAATAGLDATRVTSPPALLSQASSGLKTSTAAGQGVDGSHERADHGAGRTWADEHRERCGGFVGENSGALVEGEDGLIDEG